MKGIVLISIIVFSLCGVVRIDAQFEDVKECLQNDQFISFVVDCFLAKFQPIIDAITRPPQQESVYSPEASYGGGSHVDRKLQSIDGSQIQSYYLKRLSTRKSREQAEVTKSSMQGIAERARQMLVELTKEISQENGQEKYLNEILDVLLEGGRINPEVLGLLSPVLAELGELRAGLDRMADALNSETEELIYDTAEDAINELQRIKSCLDELDEEEFEDGFTWLRCLYSCSDLPLTSSCFIDNFNTIPACARIPWVADLMTRLFVDYMKLQTCYFEILSPNRSSTPLDLIEGRGFYGTGDDSASQVIEFRSYLPPGVHCFPANAIANRRALIGDIIGLVFNTTAPCVVQIQMTTSNYIYDILPYIRLGNDSFSLGRPRCRNNTAINQISIGWHDNAVNASGIIVLERDNWNATFRIPVAARIDHKVEDDEYTEVNFTMKMVVDGAILNSTKVLTRVFDRDVDSSICQSINDPHIVTFDNSYYNNLYQGYFTMYKHTALPYEVQIIYQSCGASAPSGESCNCGVAVRSGDDVFVVDRCRLKPEHCTGEDCRLLKVTLYVNGALTPGTRIFQEDGGLSYQIVLPHGTIVKVKSNGQELINVWIIPSPYDRENTVGLCGTFNVNPEDDFTLPDGSVLNITDSETVQPKDFIEAWRVPSDKRIFVGVVSDESFRPGNFCRCSHYVVSGIECHCGYEELVETCDFSLGNEFTSENLTSLVRHSIRGSDPYLNQSTYEDKRDINETLTPSDPSFQDRDEIKAARDYCNSFLRRSEENLLKKCKRVSKSTDSGQIAPIRDHESIENAFKGCMDDYKITHSNATVEWKMAATDAAKVGCLTWFQRSPKVSREKVIDTFVNETCINECYGRGDCEYGRCVCGDGFGGADCGLVLSSSSSSGVPVLLTEDPLLCDRRHEDCAFATIYGKNFTDDDSIVCTSTQIQVLDTESVSSSVKSSDVTVLFVNLNQMSCRLPFAASYRITVKHNGMVLSPPKTGRQYSSEITFMTYDSVCYTCDTSTEKCVQKQDRSYCMISGVCYANLQPYAADNCRYCNVTYSKDYLYDSQDPYCVQKRTEEAEIKAADKKNQDIRIAVGCSLSAIIIIISIIAFIQTKRKEKKMKSAEKSEIGSSIGDKITYTNPEFSSMEPVSELVIGDKGKPPSSTSANNNTLSPYENTVVEVSPYYEETPPPTDSSTSGCSSTASPPPPPVTRSPPDTIIVKHRDLARVRGVMEAEGRNRTTSISSGTSNMGGGEPLSRRGSDAASIKSLGIGGGGPISYGRVIALPRSRNNSTGDQMGIGAHGMPSSSATAAGQSPSAFVSEKL